jgi:hypothetical protein
MVLTLPVVKRPERKAQTTQTSTKLLSLELTNGWRKVWGTGLELGMLKRVGWIAPAERDSGNRYITGQWGRGLAGRDGTWLTCLSHCFSRSTELGLIRCCGRVPMSYEPHASTGSASEEQHGGRPSPCSTFCCLLEQRTCRRKRHRWSPIYGVAMERKPLVQLVRAD